MRFVLLMVFPALFAFQVQAAEISVEGGFRQQSGSTSISNESVKSQTGYQLGATALFPLKDSWLLRTGLFYVQRPVSLQDDVSSGEAKLSMSYFEVPVAIAYHIEGYAHLFLGTALSTRLNSNSSTSGTLTGYKLTQEKDMVTPLLVGASFKFASDVGATLFFETISGDVAKDISGYRAVGLNIFFTID